MGCKSNDWVAGAIGVSLFIGLFVGGVAQAQAQTTGSVPRASATSVKLAPPWGSMMDAYRDFARQCQQGDGISCRQAKETTQTLLNIGWCASGANIAPCPGYTVVTSAQWKAHLAEVERRKPRPKLDPNNPYVQRMQRHYKNFGDWAELQGAANPY